MFIALTNIIAKLRIKSRLPLDTSGMPFDVSTTSAAKDSGHILLLPDARQSVLTSNCITWRSRQEAAGWVSSHGQSKGVFYEFRRLSLGQSQFQSLYGLSRRRWLFIISDTVSLRGFSEQATIDDINDPGANDQSDEKETAHIALSRSRSNRGQKVSWFSWDCRRAGFLYLTDCMQLRPSTQLP
jgi:hypothetical protein